MKLLHQFNFYGRSNKSSSTQFLLSQKLVESGQKKRPYLLLADYIKETQALTVPSDLELDLPLANVSVRLVI